MAKILTFDLGGTLMEYAGMPAKQQYLVFSENLYNNVFYDSMSDDDFISNMSICKT